MATACAGCGTSVADGQVLYTPDARAVCAKCFDKVDLTATKSRASKSAVGLIGIGAGAVIGLVPFNSHAITSSVVSFGNEVHVTFRDYVAIACGAAAALIGFSL